MAFQPSNNEVIIILSGGLDSSSMLYHLAATGYTIKEAITFNYGQRHSKETTHASQVANRFSQDQYAIKHHIVDISSIGSLIASGALTGDEEVPKEMYDSQNQRSTVVPNRNMIFLSIAAGRAVALKASYIAYAAHASDYAIYPDCRPEFVEQLDKALLLGNLWDPIKLLAPFIHMTKGDIVGRAIELNVPMEETWSCYEGGTRPCLRCGTCLERTEAFLAHNIPDPALSADEWQAAVAAYHELSQ